MVYIIKDFGRQFKKDKSGTKRDEGPLMKSGKSVVNEFILDNRYL